MSLPSLVYEHLLSKMPGPISIPFSYWVFDFVIEFIGEFYTFSYYFSSIICIVNIFSSE